MKLSQIRHLPTKLEFVGITVVCHNLNEKSYEIELKEPIRKVIGSLHDFNKKPRTHPKKNVKHIWVRGSYANKLVIKGNTIILPRMRFLDISVDGKVFLTDCPFQAYAAHIRNQLVKERRKAVDKILAATKIN